MIREREVVVGQGVGEKTTMFTETMEDLQTLHPNPNKQAWPGRPSTGWPAASPHSSSE